MRQVFISYKKRISLKKASVTQYKFALPKD